MVFRRSCTLIGYFDAFLLTHAFDCDAPLATDLPLRDRFAVLADCETWLPMLFDSATLFHCPSPSCGLSYFHLPD